MRIFIIISILLIMGCTKQQESHRPEIYIASCCKFQDTSGVYQYPDSVPLVHQNLCEQIKTEMRDGDTLINGDYYLATSVDCGDKPGHIGDEYY